MIVKKKQLALSLQCIHLILVSLREFIEAYHKENGKHRTPRRWWVRNVFQRRKLQGDYDNLVAELRDDPEMFKAYSRLSVEQFDDLLDQTRSFLQKTSQREPIEPGARLMLTLRYLASGNSMRSMSFAFRVGASTVSSIVKETCDVLWDVLAPKYLKDLKEDDWNEIANEFYDKWDLPNCIGALDGKHVNIKCPANSGSNYYNYKNNYSIVLMALCDANLKFTSVDIGGYGSSSDGGILKNSMFGQYLQEGKLNIPQDAALPGDTVPMPFYIVGDEAFPLTSYLMRPFGGRGLCEEKKIFNYRLSRARRCIENAFGLMVARWRVFHTVLEAKPSTVDSIIKACVVLHNYLITTEDLSVNINGYKTASYVDREDAEGNVTLGEWRNNASTSALQSHTLSGKRMGAYNAPRQALAIREHLKTYVCDIDPTPWQVEHIRRGTNPDEKDMEMDSDSD